MMKYHDQLKHPLWQKKRLEVMERAGFECENCGGKEDTLNVHHPYYKRGAMIWDYESGELQCLCERCHKIAHEIDEKLKFAVSTFLAKDKIRVLGYVHSFYSVPQHCDEEYMTGYVDGIRANTEVLAYHLMHKP
jgi:Zn finger protein HypA/HybF involved in hydrogenase expression